MLRLSHLHELLPKQQKTVEAANDFLSKLDSQLQYSDDDFTTALSFELMGELIERLGPKFHGGREWLVSQLTAPLLHPLYRIEAAKTVAHVDRESVLALEYLRWEIRRELVIWEDDAKEEVVVPQSTSLPTP